MYPLVLAALCIDGLLSSINGNPLSMRAKSVGAPHHLLERQGTALVNGQIPQPQDYSVFGNTTTLTINLPTISPALSISIKHHNDAICRTTLMDSNFQFINGTKASSTYGAMQNDVINYFAASYLQGTQRAVNNLVDMGNQLSANASNVLLKSNITDNVGLPLVSGTNSTTNSTLLTSILTNFTGSAGNTAPNYDTGLQFINITTAGTLQVNQGIKYSLTTAPPMQGVQVPADAQLLGLAVVANLIGEYVTYTAQNLNTTRLTFTDARYAALVVALGVGRSLLQNVPQPTKRYPTGLSATYAMLRAGIRAVGNGQVPVLGSTSPPTGLMSQLDFSGIVSNTTKACPAASDESVTILLGPGP